MAGSLKSLSFQSGKSSSSSSSSFSQNVTGSGNFNKVPLDRGGMTLAPARDSAYSADYRADARDDARWELRLSFGQLIVFWSAICGTLIMVFLFGLYAGREQGVQAALDSRSGEGIRLPVMNAAPLPTDTAALASAVPNIEPVAPAPAAATEPVPIPEPAPPAVTELSPPSLPAPLPDTGASEVALPEKAAEAELAPPQEAADEKPAPAKAVPEKKTEPVKSVKAENLRSGWYLQVAAARTSSESAAIVRKLQTAGLKPIVESAKIGGSTYYRVNLGPYPTKDSALKARKSVLSAKAAKGEPFAKQIK